MRRNRRMHFPVWTVTLATIGIFVIGGLAFLSQDIPAPTTTITKVITY